MMVRIDPDKVTPLKDEAASKAYLAKPRGPGSERRRRPAAGLERGGTT